VAKTMRALQKIKPEPGAELKEVVLPEVGSRDALIKVDVTGICGSDVQLYNWSSTAVSKITRRGTKFPFTFGHEFSGTVVEVGKDVQSVKPGDRVAGETHAPCGQCFPCKTGHRHICTNMKLLGSGLPGIFSDYAVLPEMCAIKLPDSLTSQQGAVLEPLGVAVHSVTEADVSGKPVVILGVGPIGLFAVAAAKHLGATQVFATARTQSKLDVAMAMGADATFNPLKGDVVAAVKAATGGAGAGAVIDMTGDPEAIMQGLSMLRTRGRLVMVAQLKGPLPPAVSVPLTRGEVQMTGIWGRRMYDTWMLIEHLVTSGKINLAKVTGDTYPLANFEAAFKDASANSLGRVLLVP
jgi:threonine 3-dehydrogenase